MYDNSRIHCLFLFEYYLFFCISICLIYFLSPSPPPSFLPSSTHLYIKICWFLFWHKLWILTVSYWLLLEFLPVGTLWGLVWNWVLPERVYSHLAGPPSRTPWPYPHEDLRFKQIVWIPTPNLVWNSYVARDSQEKF